MVRFRKIKFLILFLLLFLFLIGATFVFAQKPLEINYPWISGVTTPTTTKTALPDYIRYIFQFSLFLGALIAFGSFIYGGVRYLTSKGKDSPTVQKDSQSQITAGVFGLIILISAYLLLNTINPQLVGLDVSSFGKAPKSPTRGVMPKLSPDTLVEIPLGGIIENLWGTKSEPKEADCYIFDENGDVQPGSSVEKQGRLGCIENLSEAIKIKAENLKKPIEKLQKLYDCQNCCRDCCKNVCVSFDEEEGWQDCGDYECCEGKGMVSTYLYQECPYSGCEFSKECRCENCGFPENWCERYSCICIKDEEGEPVCCNSENDPDKPYEDLLVRSLIDKRLIDDEKEDDPYEDLIDIKTALKELRIKIGLFPLTEEMLKEEMGELKNLDTLLADENTKGLIKELLIGNPPDKDKLKEFLKNKCVMKHLVENNWLSANRNLAKIMLQNLNLLKNEIAINEIAWVDGGDEWIELYNNTRGNIDLNGWKLIVKGSPETELSGTISPQGFYLLKNLGGNLSDNGETLELYDEFGNLEEVVDCSFDWFAGDKENKNSMERIDPKYESGSTEDNWATSLSSEGTPNEPNTLGVVIDSYSSFDSLVGEMIIKLSQEESLREKLILVLRKDENLEKMLKTEDALSDMSNILMGDDLHFKSLLSQKKILGLLLEDKENLNSLLLEDDNAKKLIQDILVKTGDWKNEDDCWEQEWQDLMDTLDEAHVNLKLIRDFQRDLEWILSTQNLMRGCEEDPVSVDQLRVPEEFLSEKKIEKVPEWEGIEAEVPWIEGIDPATFYCHKLLW